MRHRSHPDKRRLATAGLLTLALLLTACATPSPPSRFYRLTPEAPVTERRSDLVVGIGPVLLAGYLDRPQLVTPLGDNQLRVDEFERWAGGLENNLATVMAENLSRLLGSDAVVTQPWASRLPIDYQVALEIRRLEPNADGQVHLVAQWRLFRGDGEALVGIHRSTFTEPMSGTGYAARAAAESRVLVPLARAIADAIRAAEKKRR